MWSFFSRKPDAEPDDFDEHDEDLVDSAALRIIARHVSEHDGRQANGVCIERAFVIGTRAAA